MKIAITGTGGIGKTTLANALSNTLDLPIISEDIDGVVKAMNILTKTQKEGGEVKVALQAYHQACIDWLNNRAKLQQAHERFVSDRFSLDILARLVVPSIQKPNDALLMKIVTECKRQAEMLDLIIMPPLAKLAKEGVANEKGLRRHDNMGMKLFSQSLNRGLMEQLFKVPRLYLPLSAKTTEQRVEIVKKVLEKLNVQNKAD